MSKAHTSSELTEDAPANCAGGGNIAGVGVDNPAKGEKFGEPGRKKRALIFRRQIWVRKKKHD